MESILSFTGKTPVLKVNVVQDNRDSDKKFWKVNFLNFISVIESY